MNKQQKIETVEKYFKLNEAIKALETQKELLRNSLIDFNNGNYGDFILAKQEQQRESIQITKVRKDVSLYNKILSAGLISSTSFITIKIVKKGE